MSNFEGIDVALNDGKEILISQENGFTKVQIYCPTRNMSTTYAKKENLTLALDKASRTDFGKMFDEKITAIEDILDFKVKNGYKLWARKEGKEVKFEIRRPETKEAQYLVLGKNFRTAYNSLCQLVSQNVLEETEPFR
ncbi:MAG: hypothetical protein WC755_03685 [Candidatus Woesearchaeota archaeon]|jgi:hypothetical protein